MLHLSYTFKSGPITYKNSSGTVSMNKLNESRGYAFAFAKQAATLLYIDFWRQNDMTGSTCGQSWPICLSKKEKSSKGKSTHVGHLLTPFSFQSYNSLLDSIPLASAMCVVYL